MGEWEVIHPRWHSKAQARLVDFEIESKLDSTTGDSMMSIEEVEVADAVEAELEHRQAIKQIEEDRKHVEEQEKLMATPASTLALIATASASVMPTTASPDVASLSVSPRDIEAEAAKAALVVEDSAQIDVSAMQTSQDSSSQDKLEASADIDDAHAKTPAKVSTTPTSPRSPDDVKNLETNGLIKASTEEGDSDSSEEGGGEASTQHNVWQNLNFCS